MANKSYLEVLQWASSFLEEKGQEVYAAEFLLLGRKRWNKTEWLFHMKKIMSIEEEAQFKADVLAFSKGMPAQYILGYGDFYGESFKVTEATLIPRPETEELVDMCLKNHAFEKGLVVADIGTGSGAIAVTLKKQQPSWQVYGVDISTEALAVAKENAIKQGVDVNFIVGDLLQPFKEQQLDIVISNPPYISYDEWEEMDESVRTHEPKLALFAEKNGLEMYEQLAQRLPKVLKNTGRAYFEIGYKQGESVQKIFQRVLPNKKVTIHQDLNGLDRMIQIQ